MNRVAPVAHADNVFPEDVARVRARLLTAEELADWLNVDRAYVYDHAADLGAMRLGTGPRARLRFDLEEVRRRISCAVGRGSESADPAPQATMRSRRHRLSGTNVELLPIRGSSPKVGGA